MDENSGNPYQSPGSSELPTQAPTEHDSPPKDKPIQLEGRFAILMLCIGFGLFAILSFMAFVFQFLLVLPSGDRFFSADPLWVVSHLVRGVALSFLSFYLWRYAAAVRRLNRRSGPLSDRFRHAHASVWNCGVWVVISLMFYSLIFAIAR